MKVPSAVAITVEMRAITSEFLSADARSGSANGCAQCSSVNPCHVKLNRPLLSLNENRTTMKIGMKRYSSASADQAPSANVRQRSERCVRGPEAPAAAAGVVAAGVAGGGPPPPQIPPPRRVWG